MNYGWRFMTLNRRQDPGLDPWIKTIPKKKKCKKAKWLSKEALPIAVKRETPKAKEKRKDLHI